MSAVGRVVLPGGGGFLGTSKSQYAHGFFNMVTKITLKIPYVPKKLPPPGQIRGSKPPIEVTSKMPGNSLYPLVYLF